MTPTEASKYLTDAGLDFTPEDLKIKRERGYSPTHTRIDGQIDYSKENLDRFILSGKNTLPGIVGSLS